MSSLTSTGFSMRACHAAGTEWNCRSEQSNLGATGGGHRGTPAVVAVALCPPFHPPPSPGCSPSALQLDVQRGEGLGADQVVHDARRVGVVRAVVKLVHGARGVLKALVSGVGGEAAGSGKVPQSLHPPQSLFFFLGGGTHFSFTSRACLSLATPMGLERSRNTAGSVRSRVSET